MVFDLFWALGLNPIEDLNDLAYYRNVYGLAGLFVWNFGDRSIWELQMKIIHLSDEKIAFSFKKLVQERCQIVAITASILAQVAITALSLDSLSQTHWAARGSFVLSLVSAIMAVCTANIEYRTFCQCLSVEDIRGWIKGASYKRPSHRIDDVEEQPDNTEMREVPPVASVVIVSAPSQLLAVALNSLLVGFGIWLGYIWTKNLDPNSTWEDSRAVFITYTVGLGICYWVKASVTFAGLSKPKPLSEWKSDLMTKTADLAPNEYSGRIEEHPQESHAHEPVIATISQSRSSHEALSNALRQTAKLRRELAESEELLAGLYERLRRE